MKRGTIVLFANLAVEQQTIPLATARDYDTLLTSHSETRIATEGLQMPGQSVLIARVR